MPLGMRSRFCNMTNIKLAFLAVAVVWSHPAASCMQSSGNHLLSSSALRIIIPYMALKCCKLGGAALLQRLAYLVARC